MKRTVAIAVALVVALSGTAIADDSRAVIEHDLSILTSAVFGAPYGSVSTQCGTKTAAGNRYCYSYWWRSSYTKCRVRWVVYPTYYFSPNYEPNCIPWWMPWSP